MTTMYAPTGMNGTTPAPNISEIGRTGRCYGSEEERQINESTCCAKEAVSQPLLEENVAITRRKEDLKSKIDRGATIALNALTPIKQLSDDVLCHIFELHCKDSLPVTLPLNHQVWESATPQITLSHVCSAWREIMLDVPTFWRSIRIVPDTPQPFHLTVKAANTWLSRAKGLPCSIDIDFPGPEDDISWSNRRWLWGKDRDVNIIRDLISLHKFENLGVTFADHQLREFLQLPDDKLSCVEDLCLRYMRLTKDDTTSPLDLHKLSNLASFSLLPIPFSFCSSTKLSKGYSKFAGLPWHILRHIHLHAIIPAPFCLNALEHCSAILETCSLVITGDHTFTSSPRVLVHLFQLRELRVIVYSDSLSRDEEILEFFLLSLRFPRLKSLTFDSLYWHTILTDLQMLLRVQNASQMHLEELIISVSTLLIDIRTLLTCFPSLRRLELPDTITFTDEAMIEVGEGSIGVFVEDLTIKNSDLDLEKLLQMVKARSPVGDKDSGIHRIEATEFKSVTLHCNEAEGEVDDNVLYFIEEIKLSGIELNVIFADDKSESGLYYYNYAI